jgi:hypothetical protein
LNSDCYDPGHIDEEACVQLDFRRASIIGLMLLATCSLASAASEAWKLNEWDVMCALRDLVHRSIALEFISIDPYRLVDPARRDINLDAPVCSLKSVKEGLVNGTCNPVAMKKCGTRCIELTIDSGVYARASRQIEADLRTPCQWLPAVKLGPGRSDTHPSFFYLGRNRAVASLGCGQAPVAIDSLIFNSGKLMIIYRSTG